MGYELSEDVLIDLLRAAWVTESGRAGHYERWAEPDARFEASRDAARARSTILERLLARYGRPTDDDLVESHSLWITSLSGDRPGEVAFGDLFASRLGSWVDAHIGPFLGEKADEFSALGEQERSWLSFPTEFPPPPPFEPLEVPEVSPPSDVLFRFGILGDLHIGSAAANDTTRSAIEDLNASGAELVIQLGDITDHGDRDEFQQAAKVLEGLEMPYVTMLGNHDVLSGAEERVTGRDYYSASFGRAPDGVLVEHRGFRFAVLDSAEHVASPFPPYDFVTGAFMDGAPGAVVRGSLTPPQHEILAEVAAPASGPAFVFLHHPPQPFTAFPPVLFGLSDGDTGRLHATCDSGNVWGVFAGHTHRNARTRTFDGVPSQEIGIPRDFPCGYALVDVSESGYSYRFLQISDEHALRAGYERAGEIQRRYARGSDEARAFVWTTP